jgi:hypothetical protein
MMFTTQVDLDEYDPVFVEAATKIAKGEPPLWLLIALTRFDLRSPDIPTPDPREIFMQMHNAAVCLETWLPIFHRLPFGQKCPDDVRVVLEALPRIRKDHLQVLAKPRRKGRRPKTGQWICAGVVVEAWRLCHGEVEPRSEELYGACEEYWTACGGERIGPGGDITKWRRHVENSLENGWIRNVMEAVRKSV